MKARRHALLCELGSSALLPQSLHLFVRHKQVLQDALKVFWQCPATELLAPNMSVSYEGEKGIDAGGLLRDWFDAVATALSVQGSPLMEEADGLVCTGPDEAWGQQELESCAAVGRFLATALLRGHPLPLQLSRGPEQLIDVEEMML